MILGVALVVDELHKGQRLVFRYPEAAPLWMAENTQRGLTKLYDQYFAISQDNFAKLFRPKNSLLNKILELTVDDLHFVSYPCQCSSDDSSNIESVSDAESSVQPSGFSYSLSMFNLVVVSSTCKAMHQICPSIKFKCQQNVGCPGYDPVAAALASTSSPSGLCTQTIKRVVESVAAALNTEEKSSRYVSRQVSSILQIIDMANKLNHHEHHTSHNSANHSGLNSGNASPVPHTSTHFSMPPFGDTNDNVNTSLTSSAAIQTVQHSESVQHSGVENSCSSDATSALPQPTLFGVVCFERTNRSVSNASAMSTNSLTGCGIDTDWSLGTQAVHMSSPSHCDDLSLSVSSDRADDYQTASTNSPPKRQQTELVPEAASTTSTHAGPTSPTHETYTSKPTASLTIASNLIPNTSSYTPQLSPGPVRTTNNSDGVNAENGSDDVPGGAVNGWNISLLDKVLLKSSLANELRVLYHSLTGGPCVNILINNSQFCLLQLYCKDVRQCIDSVHNRINGLNDSAKFNTSSKLRMSISQNTLIGGGIPSSLSHQSIVSNGGTTSSMSSRHRLSFTSSAAVVATNNSIYDFAKQRGINLETETALPIADFEVVWQMLESKGMFSTERVTSQSLSEEESSIRNSIEDGRLKAFVETADPTLSFFDLSLALDEPIEELVVMCAQLQMLGLVEVVSIIYNQSVFRIHREAPTHRDSHVAKAFRLFIRCLHIDFNADCGDTEGADSSNSNKVDNFHNSGSGSGGMRKSQSYSHNSGQHTRARADSEGGGSGKTAVKHVTSSGAIDFHRGGGDSDTSSSSQRPNSTYIAGIDTVQNYNLDSISLTSILCLFNGKRNMRDVINCMVRPLQRFGVNVVIFLLRWHMLTEVSAHILNMSRLPAYNLRDNMLQTSQPSTAPLSLSSQQLQQSGGASEHAQQTATIVSNSIQQLSAREHLIYDKLAPFIHNCVLSHKTLSDIMWSAQISEIECNRVLKKLPHLITHKG